MLGIPRRHAHYVFGVLQSGLTSAIASAVANLPTQGLASFARHWLPSWLLAWSLMLPIVFFAAPLIRRVSLALTQDD